MFVVSSNYVSGQTEIRRVCLSFSTKNVPSSPLKLQTSTTKLKIKTENALLVPQLWYKIRKQTQTNQKSPIKILKLFP